MTIAGLTLDLIGAVVVTLAVFRVSVDKVYEQALSTPKADAAEVNTRAKWLGEERAYARAGVGLITSGIALQLVAATFGGLHGMTEWLVALAAVGLPIVAAACVLKFLVRRWNTKVSDARARPEQTPP